MTADGTIVAFERRLRLVEDAPLFADLPPAARRDAAARLGEVRYAAGAVIVAEGEASDRLYLIASGTAEVSTAGSDGPIPLATVGPGEFFGEAGLLDESGLRTATVTASTALIVLSMDRPSFDAVLAAHPAARCALAGIAEARAIANFLKQVSPFAPLTPERRAQLAARLAPRTIGAGNTIVRQGESGDECFLLRRGRVEVLLEDATGATRRLATLGPGALIGETALLTAAPRSATVRALEPCDLLTLARADLFATLNVDAGPVGARLLELVQLRARPRQGTGVQAHRRATPDGGMMTVLKDPERGAYFRLSPEGTFVWERLDGAHTLRDLTLDYFTAYKRFSPAAIAGVIGDLVQAGLVAVPGLAPDAQSALVRLSWWQKLLVRARSTVEWRAALSGVDGPLTRLYQGGVRVLYTRLAQICLGVVALLGLVAFLATSLGIGGTFHRAYGGGRLAVLLIPAYLLAILVHEAAHAFTVKAFGREVPRVGVGWHWFFPIAYVDTSDMWLAGRWPRIAVSLAGPYSNLVLAGIAALLGWGMKSPAVAAALWLFALTSYLGALPNLIPILELDGYYVLVDALDRPNLRAQALAWLGRECFPTLHRDGWSGLRGHGVDLAYGVLSLLALAGMAALTILAYRLTLARWLATFVSGGAAAGLAWVLGVAVVALAVATTIGDLRGGHAAATG